MAPLWYVCLDTLFSIFVVLIYLILSNQRLLSSVYFLFIAGINRTFKKKSFYISKILFADFINLMFIVYSV